MWLDVISRKNRRREKVRKDRPDTLEKTLKGLRHEGGLLSLWTAAGFCALAFLILLMRENVVQYRPGQWAVHDIVARVDFAYQDDNLLEEAKRHARENQARVYKPTTDVWQECEEDLRTLPDRVVNSKLEELPAALQHVLDAATLAKIQEYQGKPARATWEKWVAQYMAEVHALNLTIIPGRERVADAHRPIVLEPSVSEVQSSTTYSPDMREDLMNKLAPAAEHQFPLTLQPKVVALTLEHCRPTHELDEAATAEAQNRAEQSVPAAAGSVQKRANMKIVPAGEIKTEDWKILQAENAEFNRLLGMTAWARRGGLLGIVAVLTSMLAAYVARYQPRVIRNHARGIAVAALLLSMLLLAQLAGVGSSPMYIFGLAPTILVAMILAIAYDQRFAVGVAAIHAVFVTMALNSGVSFFLILMSGVVTACFMLDDLRTRSKLIEIGGATALAMILSTAAAGLLTFDPISFVARNCLYAGAAGLAVGFVVLGILPFIEKAFRITTGMTLLELADASQPLLRRLSVEAPGTYNHSLQVATLSEEAAEAIGANALLCRVAAYYHDVGKISKADYFVENQVDGHNRHLNLSPNVSLIIIKDHVKYGVDLAKEYNLPTSLIPFIQQHHGTTLVEFFYHRACQQQEKAGDDQPAVAETEFRYPGPKPRSREIAILMLADCVESATRALPEPTHQRIEALVHDLATKRLLDGQFDDCDLTMRDIATVEESMVATLRTFYHSRIAYPDRKTKVGGTGSGIEQAHGPRTNTA